MELQEEGFLPYHGIGGKVINTMDLKVLVGMRIRQMRLAKGMKQSKLAETISTSDSYMASIERGKRNLSIDSLQKITVALGARPIDALRFGELDENLGDKRENLQLLAAFLEERTLEEIELVRRMAKDIMHVIDLQKGHPK